MASTHGEFGWILEDNQGMMSIAQLPGATINHRYRIYREGAGLGQFDPGRGVVGGFFLGARPFVDAGAAQPVGGLRASRADGRCGSRRRAASAPAVIVPEGVEPRLVRVERAQAHRSSPG